MPNAARIALAIVALQLFSAISAADAVFESDSAHLDDEPAIRVFVEQSDITSGKETIANVLSKGEVLFSTKFNRKDGAGRPFATGDSKPTPRLFQGPLFTRLAGPDAMSCSGCHNEPVVGGSGDAPGNVFVGAQFSDPPTSSIEPKITNERNTITLFGSGLIESLAMEITQELQAQRMGAIGRAKLEGKRQVQFLASKGISFGSISVGMDGIVNYSALEGIDYDLIVKPFGVKGVIISLREFSVVALNHHHGIQAEERFGWERTGVLDFDGDGIEKEFSRGQVTSLALFQAALPPPRQAFSDNLELRKFEKIGEHLFSKIGCASCHLPELVLESPEFIEPNIFNRPGALADKSESIKFDLTKYLLQKNGKFVVSAFTDLKRHRMCDSEIQSLCNEKRKQDNIALDYFMTQKLWDISTSAPYCHRGDCGTLSEAILSHGGEGRIARDNYASLAASDRKSLIAYLNTLGRAEYHTAAKKFFATQP